MAGRRRPWLRFAGLVAAGLTLQLLRFPWHPIVLRPGIDISYYYALNELFIDRVQFAGTVHPHGPYGFLKNDLYHPETFHLLVLTRLASFAVFALLAARAASRWAVSLRSGSLWIVMLVAVAWYGEAYFTSLAMLTFLAFWSASDTKERALWLPAALALSLASLMKFTFGLMIASLVGLMVFSVLRAASGGGREPRGDRADRRRRGVARPCSGGVLPWAAPVRSRPPWSSTASRLRPARAGSESHALPGRPPDRRVLGGVSLSGRCLRWRSFAAGVRALAPAAALGLWLVLAATLFLRTTPTTPSTARSRVCYGDNLRLLMLRPSEHGTRRCAAARPDGDRGDGGCEPVADQLRSPPLVRRRFFATRLRRRALEVVQFIGDPSHVHDRHERTLSWIRELIHCRPSTAPSTSTRGTCRWCLPMASSSIRARPSAATWPIDRTSRPPTLITLPRRTVRNTCCSGWAHSTIAGPRWTMARPGRFAGFRPVGGRQPPRRSGYAGPLAIRSRASWLGERLRSPMA
jgi:hypothetical protein